MSGRGLLATALGAGINTFGGALGNYWLNEQKQEHDLELEAAREKRALSLEEVKSQKEWNQKGSGVYNPDTGVEWSNWEVDEKKNPDAWDKESGINKEQAKELFSINKEYTLNNKPATNQQILDNEAANTNIGLIASAMKDEGRTEMTPEEKDIVQSWQGDAGTLTNITKEKREAELALKEQKLAISEKALELREKIASVTSENQQLKIQGQLDKIDAEKKLIDAKIEHLKSGGSGKGGKEEKETTAKEYVQMANYLLSKKDADGNVPADLKAKADKYLNLADEALGIQKDNQPLSSRKAAGGLMTGHGDGAQQSTPPLNIWLSAARKSNPKASDSELKDFYNQKYGRR